MVRDRLRGSLIGALLLLSACASLPPALPELFYRVKLDRAPDTACAQLAQALVTQANLARDASFSVPLGGTRCHEILYAADGNEIWIELTGSELSLALHYYPQPGDLEPPGPGTQILADEALGQLRRLFPDAVIERSRAATR